MMYQNLGQIKYEWHFASDELTVNVALNIDDITGKPGIAGLKDAWNFTSYVIA